MKMGRENGKEDFGVAFILIIKHSGINDGKISIMLNYLIQNTTGAYLREE
jgi:hypothetical protein